MPKQPHEIDAIFRALADPTRRAVLAKLDQGSRTVSELSDGFGMALPSFMQHLQVLEDAGIVQSQKVGRVRHFSVCADALIEAESWMQKRRSFWEKRLDQMDNYLLALKEKDNG